jgi:hypothetical protein
MPDLKYLSRVLYIKTLLQIEMYYVRVIGSYIRSWERPGDLPSVIEILCLFAGGAQRNDRKETKKYITNHNTFLSATVF